MTTRTITQLVRQAKTTAKRLTLMRMWASDWKSEQALLIHRIFRGANAEDFDELSIVTSQLRAVTEKKFVALENCLSLLDGTPDWINAWSAEQVSLVNQLGQVTAKLDYIGAELIAEKLTDLNSKFDLLVLLLSEQEEEV